MSYWGIFGWLDTGLSWWSGTATAAIGRCVLLGSAILWVLAVIAVFAWAARALGVAQRRGLRAALAILGRDPLSTSLGLFVVMMTGLHLAWGGTFGFQGRYWLPLAIASTYMAAFVAPRAIPLRPLRAPVTVLTITCLLAYSLVGSAYAMHSVTERYYGAPNYVVTLRRHFIDDPEVGPYHIETALFGGQLVTANRGVRGRGQLTLQGWATPHGGALGGVLVDVDGKPWASGTTDRRGDVAAAFHNDGLTVSGFRVSLVPPPGRHRITLRFIESDGVGEVRPKESYDLDTIP